jgi:hypothetical protein
MADRGDQLFVRSVQAAITYLPKFVSDAGWQDNENRLYSNRCRRLYGRHEDPY